MAEQLQPVGFARYTWPNFRADLIAGLTVAAVAVPQAMAYALIAGVDPRYGLYTAIVIAALGSIFTSSSHLIDGPTNAISLVVLSAIAGLGLKDPDKNLQAVFLLALMVGTFQVLFYFFKLGDLTRYISESVVLGFMVGAGFLVALSQIPNLLGLSRPGGGEEYLLLRLGRTLIHGGMIQPLAVILGIGTAALVVGLRRIGNRIGIPVPDMLLALVVASVAAYLLDWREGWNPLPAELPRPRIPRIQWEWVRGLSGSALAIAVLGLLEAIAIAKSIAIKTRQPLDCNRQCLAEGLANLGGGLFQCIPGSGSLTRSAINFQAGAVSRLSGIISAVGVALTVVLFADLAQFVPKPALAGILLVTAWRLVDRSRVLYCLRATRFDRNIALATAGSAVFVSIEFSILIGVFLSFLFFVPRVARLRVAELTISPERVVRERLPDDLPCDKLVVLELEGELFFGVAPELDTILAGLTVRARAGARLIVLRLKRTRNPDMVCMEKLQHFLEEMHREGVVVLLCGVREDFALALDRLGFHDWLPADRIFFEDTPMANGDGLALSSTLKAIKRAYEILGMDLCATCPRRFEMEREREKGWYYMI